jgi:signal transduction histidine kinase/ligand-binding sensor domain-containing protein
MVFRFILTLLFILEFIPIIASAQDIKFEAITTNEGLSQSSVGCLLQDQDGFMWFGTMNGLNRFDGFKFVKYYHNPADSMSLAGNQIDCIYQDSHGELWIGSDGGLSRYDRDLDNFVNFTHKDKDSNTISGHRAFCFFEDSKGRYWVGTMGDGLNLFNGKDNKFTHFKHSESDPKSLSNNDVRSIIEDKDGNILAATMGGGLNLLNPETKNIIRFTHNENDPGSIAYNDVFSLAKDRNNTIWIGTLGGGLCRMNFSNQGRYFFDTFKPVTSNADRNKILALFADHKDGIWIGTENGGLDYFNIRNKSFVNYCVDENDPTSLNNNSVHAIYEDKTENLWVGTYTGGVNVVKKNKKMLYTYAKIPGNLNSLSYNAVSCFFEDKDCNLWIGTDGGGINILNRKTDKMTHYNSKNSSMKSDAILAICNDKDDDIWIGGWGCGLTMYNRKNNTFRTLSQERDGIPTNNIFDILVDHKGRIWIAFGNVGLANYDKKSGSFRIYSTQNSNLPSNWVLNLTEDCVGNIILGLTDGFSIFNPERETFETFDHKEGDDNSLSYNQVNTIIPGNDSTIWIGTVFGLNNYNPGNRKFTQFFAKDGLPDNNITGLAQDDHGCIWSSTSNGISRYNPKTGTFRNYTVKDGLQGNGYIRNSCYKTARGEILFGGTNGFNIFVPDSLIDNPNLPRVVISGLSIFNKPVKPGEPGSPLSKQISQTRRLVLSYKQFVFSFEFAALEYTSPGQNQYAYKLDGFEKDWNFVGTNHTATYTNLDPGNYTLRVMASNNDGKWNKSIQTLDITITPPYWETWWFRILILLFGIILISSYFGIRIRRIKRNNLLLENQVEERTMELNAKNKLLLQQTDDLNETNVLLEERQQHIETQSEELMAQKEELIRINIELNELNATKDKFFSIIAHDIKNPFHTLMGFAELMQINFGNWTEDKKLQIVHKLNTTSKYIYELLENLLQWSRSQRGTIEYNPEKIHLQEQIDYILMLLKNSADAKEIGLRSTLPDENLYVNVDIRMLHTILRNLVSNAVKFTNAGGLIIVEIESKEREALIRIVDNGVGISSETLMTIFDIGSHHSTEGTNKERGTGLGLILSKEFIEKNKGKIWVESVEGKGSIFSFTLPLFTHS